MTDSVQNKLIDEQNQKTGIVFGGSVDENNADYLTFPIAIFNLFKAEGDMLGFYVQLRWLHQIGGFHYKTQKEAAESIGYSEPTFITKKNKLINMGLLAVQLNGRAQVLVFKKIDMVNTKVLVKEQADILAHEIVKKQKIKEEKEEQRFPAEDYHVILEAYTQSKGITLEGPEIARAKHAIKQMFLAKRTPQQVIACMQFFTQYQKAEGYEWLGNWKLETVMKMMPEFVAGKLKPHRMEDDYRDL